LNETTIRVPQGVARFYRDYSKFVGVPFEAVLESELISLARSLLDEMRGLPNFSAKSATRRYGFGF